ARLCRTEKLLVDHISRLRALGLGAAVIDVLDRKVELVVVAFATAEFATIGQHPRQRDAVLVIERHHPVVEDLGRGDRGLAVIEFGEGDLGIGINKGLLIDPPDALQGADVKRVLGAAIAGALAFRTRHAPPCRPWPSRARRSAPRSTGCRPAPPWLRAPSAGASSTSNRGAATHSAPRPAKSTARAASGPLRRVLGPRPAARSPSRPPPVRCRPGCGSSGSAFCG